MFSQKSNNKNRNRSYNRFHRELNIKRKKLILKNIMSMSEDYFTPKRVGFLSKGKVHCSCKMCRYAQYYGFDKFKYENKKKLMKQEIKDYFQFDE